MAVVKEKVDQDIYIGLSTDAKPTKRIAIGTVFRELDTGLEYRYNGDNTEEVGNKIFNRMVFGNPLICNLSLKMYDAETRGKEWALYEADGKKLMIEKI